MVSGKKGSRAVGNSKDDFGPTVRRTVGQAGGKSFGQKFRRTVDQGKEVFG